MLGASCWSCPTSTRESRWRCRSRPNQRLANHIIAPWQSRERLPLAVDLKRRQLQMRARPPSSTPATLAEHGAAPLTRAHATLLQALGFPPRSRPSSLRKMAFFMANGRSYGNGCHEVCEKEKNDQGGCGEKAWARMRQIARRGLVRPRGSEIWTHEALNLVMGRSCHASSGAAAGAKAPRRCIGEWSCC